MTFDERRRRMVEMQLAARGIADARVLSAFRRVPRHLFVPPDQQEDAYSDHPLSIGYEQTISQPYIVAISLEALRLQGHERVLEIGSGSGYQLALLGELALEVYSVERIPELAERSQQRLRELGATNVHIRAGNGAGGWPEHAPYDAIIVSAAALETPPALVEQLGEPGRLVIPLGPPEAQMLTLIQRQQGQVHAHGVARCVFVPLIGSHASPEGAE